MIGIILIAALNVAMFTWFFYLAAKDPSNVFRRRRPEDRANEQANDVPGDQGGDQPPPQA